jgi:hypothetical protein
MRLILLLIFFVFSSALAQVEMSSQILDIDYGKPGEETLIFLTTGQVVTLDLKDIHGLGQLERGLKEKTWFRFVIEKRKIVHFEEIESPNQRDQVEKFFSAPYRPTVLSNLDEARSYFYDARYLDKESQCYNRAHVWAYDWRVKRNLYSSKTWLFFTRQYIRKYKFEWWFHVAPSVHVTVDGQVRERVMDIKYAKGPLKLKQWTDIFMRDNADCPVVKNYFDQADHPETGSCFVMRSSMYYYQPIDLELRDLTGQEKDRWIESEVKQAFLEAFDVVLGEEK